MGGNGGGAWVDSKGYLRYDGDRRTSGERSPTAGKPASPHAFQRHAVLPTTGLDDAHCWLCGRVGRGQCQQWGWKCWR